MFKRIEFIMISLGKGNEGGKTSINLNLFCQSFVSLCVCVHISVYVDIIHIHITHMCVCVCVCVCM